VNEDTGSAALNLTQNAIKVLEKRYLKRDKEGNVVETPDDLFNRVAGTIANADRGFGADDNEVNQTKEKFYNFIAKKYFMPNSGN
jgi:ribonucleoside-diphosphate reductase alpha chain